MNVNISVRFDSPGDNGEVTQINAALAQPLPVAAPPEVRYQAPDPQYHDPSGRQLRLRRRRQHPPILRRRPMHR